MTEHRDDDLEAIMRAGLQGKAEEVENHGGYAARARAGARTRRRTRIGLVAAATAAVIVAGVVATDLVDDPGVEKAPVAGPTNTGQNSTDPTSDPQVPANWRVESYRGVQLRVPPDWGWGGAPRRDYDGNGVIFCGQGAHAYPGADGETRFDEQSARPYVGRADYTLSDLCTSYKGADSGAYWPDESGDWPVDGPSYPWVWFGASVDVGAVELSNEFVQRTVEVAGVRVTVGDDDADELALILASLEPVAVDANGCDTATRPISQLPPAGIVGFPEAFRIDFGEVESASVCAYRREDSGPDVFLGYSTTISAAAARDIVDTLEQGPFGHDRCAVPDGTIADLVQLRFHSETADVDVQVRLGCVGYFTEQGIVEVTRANAMPWIVDAIGLYVSDGSAGKGLTGLFHPIPG